jgi:hypothetical protein
MLNLFNRMQSEGLERDAFTFNIMMNAFNLKKDFIATEKLFQIVECLRSRLNPTDEITRC